MRFDNSPAIWEGIGDLENAIIRVQLQLDMVSKDIRFGVGGAEDDKVVVKRLKKDLRSLLASTFPKIVRLLASISGGLRQLESPHKNENDKDSTISEDGAWEEFGISPSPDNIKIEDVDELSDMGEDWNVSNDDYRDSNQDTDPLAMADSNINVDVNVGDLGTGIGIGHPPLIEGPISSTRNTRPGPKSRIRQEDTVSNVVRRERKQNLKFMSSCKDGKEITPPSPFVLLIDDVKDKMNNIARRGDDAGPLNQYLRKRVSRKKPLKITDEDPDHSGNDQFEDDDDRDSSGDMDFKPDINQPGSDEENLLSSDELDDTDISEDYEPPTKKANKRVTKTRRKRTKLDMSTDDGHSKESICSICSEICPNFFKLKHHVLVRHPRSYFDLYGPKNTTVEDWMQCVNLLPDGTADDTFPFKCSICGRPYPRIGVIRNHMQTHYGISDDKKYQCEQCGKFLNSQVLLRAHVRCKHMADQESSEDRKHICSCCNKGFSSLKALRLHMSFKEKEKLAGTDDRKEKHVCSVCNKSLFSRAALTEHMRLHYGVKPLLCPHPGCGKRFRQQGTLYNHLEGVHSKTEKYQCSICGKKYRWRRSHAVHMASHDGPKILCSLCPMMFTQPNNLKKHVAAVHNQIRPFPCHLCPSRFKQKSNLQYHLNTHNNPGGRKRGLNRIKE